MSKMADPRLQRLLGGPELAAVRTRLRRHFERLDQDSGSGTLQLVGLDREAHRALCQLTGKPSRPARSMTLDITALDASLRAAGVANSLRDALERLEGPIIPKARLRRELQEKWSELLQDSAQYGSILQTWLASPSSAVLLKRLGRTPERAADLLRSVDAVLQRLPAHGVPRSQLAAETLGDAHALDVGRPVATLVLAAWRHHERAAASDHVAKVSGAALHGGEEAPAGTDGVLHETLREVWARAGVLVNELARPALLLNVPIAAGPAYWAAGEPAYLSLRQLLRTPPSWRVEGCAVFVCENPNIVAIAADRLGENCAPLVCTDGMPAAAQRALLSQLVGAGATLFYHGDYDWPGITIGNFVMRNWGARAWRYGACDYLDALTRSPERVRDLPRDGIEADWDVRLHQVMQEQGLVVAEEAVVDELLRDLGNGAASVLRLP